MPPISRIDHLFAGGLENLEPEGQRTGIYKRRVPGAARVDALGIVGDEQGDPRVRGGPEKAVHQYAAAHYARLADVFPECSARLVPGSLGENVSAHGMTDGEVHVGDVFRMGSVVFQVSQPRSPCWKINHRFGVERMSMFVLQTRITGWCYSVVSPGSMQVGDAIVLLKRYTQRFSIEQFWAEQT